MERGAPDRRALIAACAAALLWVSGAALLDGYVSHGWTARFFVQDGEETVEVARTTEHRVAFPNMHRPYSRVVQGWPMDQLGVPEDLPPLDARLAADVEVPARRRVVFAVDSPNDTTLEIDGEVGGGPVGAGRHRVVVRWTARAPRHEQRGDHIRLALRWGTSARSLRPVPRTAFTPAAGAWPFSRVALWVLAILGALAWAGFVYRALAAPVRAVRVRRLAALATAVVILLGLGMRGFDYEVMPEFRENADELFATWNGWSLLDDGTPRGWSLWPGAYGDRVERSTVHFFGEERIVIEPYFEHPPLLHLLVGAAAHLGGADHWLEAKLRHTRLVPLLLSGLSLWLMIGIGRRLFPESPAPWLGAGLYAVLPTIVLQNRVIKEEVLLIPLLLGALLLFLRWRDERPRHLGFLVGAAVLVGCGLITKVPAIVWVPALTMLVAAEGRMREAWMVAGIGLGVSALLLVYGVAIDASAFFEAQAHQGGRPTHWNLFPRWFHVTLINHNIVGRGWIQFLWLAFAAAVFQRGWRDHAVLTVPLVTYLAAISLGSGNWTFGWYVEPLYPLLCLGAGAFLAELWQKPTLLGGFLFVVLLVFYGLNFTVDVHWAKQPPSWPPLRRWVMLTTAAFMVPYALVQVWPDRTLPRWLAKTATVVGLAVTVLASAHFVVRYDTIFDAYRDFDRDGYFDR